MKNDTVTSEKSSLDVNPDTKPSNDKLIWIKPELQKIDAGSDTKASKPNNAAFESSPGWGIS